MSDVQSVRKGADSRADSGGAAGRPDFDRRIERRGTGSLKWDRFAGRDVLPFWVADMDFRSPPEVIAAARERVEHGIFGYGKPHPGLEEATLEYLKRDHAAEVDPDWIVWLPGLVPALNMACRAAGAIGDSILTCSPVYPPFLSAPKNADRELIDVPLMLEGDRWTFDFAAMDAAARPDTRLFMLCNPHNPVGRAFTRDEVREVIDFCDRHKLILCSDEIHCDLILEPGIPHVTAATWDGPIRERTITLMAPSKTYNIAGLGFSFAVIPNAALRAAFRRAGQGFLAEINVAAVFAAEAAYRFGEPWRRELLDYLRANRAALYDFVTRELPEVKMVPMEATYLAWMDMRPLGLGSHPAKFFEHEAGVGLSEGVTFGLPGFARFNFGCPRDLMLEGLQRMKAAIDRRD